MYKGQSLPKPLGSILKIIKKQCKNVYLGSQEVPLSCANRPLGGPCACTPTHTRTHFSGAALGTILAALGPNCAIVCVCVCLCTYVCVPVHAPGAPALNPRGPRTVWGSSWCSSWFDLRFEIVLAPSSGLLETIFGLCWFHFRPSSGQLSDRRCRLGVFFWLLGSMFVCHLSICS